MKIPSDLRAESYVAKDTTAFKAGFSGAGDKAATPEMKPLKSRMSAGFNQTTGATKPFKVDQSHNGPSQS